MPLLKTSRRLIRQRPGYRAGLRRGGALVWKAELWYRKAADQGQADAQYKLGVLYANGPGVSQDYAEAARWFVKAADHGHADAQSYLGVVHARLTGLTGPACAAAPPATLDCDRGLANRLGLQEGPLGDVPHFGRSMARP